MSYPFHAEDAAALRHELQSLRARQEVLADALAAAGEELGKLGPENERLRAALGFYEEFDPDRLKAENERLRAALNLALMHLEDPRAVAAVRAELAVVRGDTDASTSGPSTEETA